MTTGTYAGVEFGLGYSADKSYSRFDPSDFIVEHYADGDLVNRKTETHREQAAKHSLYVWGPNVPKSFLSANVQEFEKAIVVEQGMVSLEG